MSIAVQSKGWVVVAGLILLIDGISLVVISLGADFLDLGRGYAFGRTQMWGLGIGVILSSLGVVVLMAGRSAKQKEGPVEP